MPTQTMFAKQLCTGCQSPIEDKYLFKVMNDSWHETCLQCTACGAPLRGSCFSRGRKLYCRLDYDKLYRTRCTGCFQTVSFNELIMRVSSFIYHVPCFCCIVCGQRLQKGEEFVLRDAQLFCRLDFEKEFSFLPLSPRSDTSDCCYGDLEGVELGNCKGPKRPRTILTTSQRRKFKAAFEVSAKPCRKVRECLAAETGLSVRVVQVWFQNQRAKVKKISRKQNLETATGANKNGSSKNNGDSNSGKNNGDSNGSKNNGDSNSGKNNGDSNGNRKSSKFPRMKKEEETDFPDCEGGHNSSKEFALTQNSSYVSSNNENQLLEDAKNTELSLHRGQLYPSQDTDSEFFDASLGGADHGFDHFEHMFMSEAEGDHHYGILTEAKSILSPIDKLYSMQTSYFTTE